MGLYKLNNIFCTFFFSSLGSISTMSDEDHLFTKNGRAIENIWRIASQFAEQVS